ncbi:hypothetical protein RUM43_014391 [Polyplax serrata]|uniref:Uncharacterized protein n=1 Tax=Polyplax serrata TaxID=468196 RepID=A0AAN8NPQ8_POLSC
MTSDLIKVLALDNSFMVSARSSVLPPHDETISWSILEMGVGYLENCVIVNVGIVMRCSCLMTNRITTNCTICVYYLKLASDIITHKHPEEEEDEEDENYDEFVN